MKNNFSKSNFLGSLATGFTLVEIITVLFIVSLGLVGILTLIIQNVQSQSYNKNNLIAYQLAQEGIELVRKVRDSNWRADLPYDDNLASGQYYMDYTDTVPRAHVPGNLDELVLRRNAANFYVHDLSATTTIFSRSITIQTLDDHSFLATSRISWSERGRLYAYNLEATLYNWR